jgi:hypothetical protein
MYYMYFYLCDCGFHAGLCMAGYCYIILCISCMMLGFLWMQAVVMHYPNLDWVGVCLSLIPILELIVFLILGWVYWQYDLQVVTKFVFGTRVIGGVVIFSASCILTFWLPCRTLNGWVLLYRYCYIAIYIFLRGFFCVLGWGYLYPRY